MTTTRRGFIPCHIASAMPFTPEHDNLVSLVREAIAKHGPRPLFGLRRGGGWTWLTYNEIGKMVDDLRGGLASLGIKPKDRVAVISNNRLEWAIACFAVQSLGATYVPMYENQLDKEWKYILGDCGAEVVLVGSAGTEKRVRDLLTELPAVRHVVGFEADDEISYRKLMEKGAAAPAPAVIPTRDEAASIIYTSGTTGNPKGVVLTHWNLATNILGTGSVVPFTPEDRSLAFLPWAHVMGGTIELGAVMNSGASTAICEDTSKLLDMLPEVKPTILVAVPRIWNRIYDGVQKLMKQKSPTIQRLFAQAMVAGGKERRGESLSVGDRLARFLARKLIYPKIVDRFGGRLSYAVSGSAALSKEVAEFVDNLGITVYEGYGMTECSGVATANSPKGGRRVGSVGKAIPGMEITLDHTAPGADEEQGEIVIRGEGVMKGYYAKPEETEATVKHGALRSGDLGRFDKDGFLYITGRVKELYKLENGKYVAPAPLEEKLQLSPYISQALVHGADKPYNIALIVPDLGAVKGWASEQGLPADGAELLRNERVRELIKKELDRWSEDWKGYERVRKFELLEEEFTTANDMLTPSLKLKRRNVLKRYDPKIQALYG
jgi:long-chain acyl-CoA synthetase